MDIFSLEEDEDMGAMFLTQESTNVIERSPILGDPMDFKSQCVGIGRPPNVAAPVYEDISDDDIFDIPCSQQIPVVADNYEG